jgi:mannose-6-phosphate isomerase-like protein (cupin superfamily)
MEAINLARKLSMFQETWAPRIIAELNGQHVKVAKLEGEFVWHRHEGEDELFLVIDGTLDIHVREPSETAPGAPYRERVVRLGPGELLVVPRRVEHKPEAIGGIAHVLLFEPASTLNIGDQLGDPRTLTAPEKI